MFHSPDLSDDWPKYLGPEFQKDYMVKLKSFLVKELACGKVIYPHGSEFFTAFKLTPLAKVKVVILGQDPYHGPGQAHGLSFSVKKNVPPPPSLVNIYKEIQGDLGLSPPRHGLLESWAKQGVLLLNSVLTVERSRACSHQGQGWETFTDKAVDILNQRKNHLVFLLWGAYAGRKGASIDSKKHKILKAPHPSPLSAHRGFFGCRHFSQANHYLKQMGHSPIDWSLP